FGGAVGVLVTPMLTGMMPAKIAVGLMLPLLFSTDIFSLFHYWRRWDGRNVSRLTPGALLGIVIGSVQIMILVMLESSSPTLRKPNHHRGGSS
ncbi:MAG: sulfite exporter TauE/SafE family protein, partial [Candidatus Poribacteria bacterium]|nr:sulfite exporter TauE/SafE family protein [Candidatus Poribacteria bacterium]